MKVGVLGLQGDVREHLGALETAGASPVIVKRPEELQSVDALVLPGGESTTIGKLLDRFGLLGPLAERVERGMPVYGTCAGMILLAARIEGRDEAPHRIAALDVTVVRNGYGRQVDSFEADVDVKGFDYPFRAVFIRAPLVEEAGPRVEVLSEVDGRPVLVREGPILASSFHPEMTGDARIHEMFLSMLDGG
jgi:5'-phosphate synthase pdxT subunit